MEERPGADFSFAKKAGLATAVALLIYAAVRAMWLIIDPLLLFFLSVVVAVGFRGATRWVSSRTGLPHAASLALVALLCYGVPITAGVLLAPHAREQASELQEQLPQLRARVDGWLRTLDWRSAITSAEEKEKAAQGAAGAGQQAAGESPQAASRAKGREKPAAKAKRAAGDAPAPGGGAPAGEAVAAAPEGGEDTGGGGAPEPPAAEEESPTEAALSAMEGQGPSGQALSWVTGFVGTLGSAFASTLFVIVVSLYLAASPRLYEGGVLKLFPRRVRPKAREIFDEMGDQLRRWVIGQIVSSVIVATATTIGLMVLGVPMSLLFGLLAGAFDVIPNFGPALAAVPTILVAAGEGKAFHVFMLFVVIQAAEGWLLRPYIEKRAVDTPPAVLLATQVALGTLLGFMGLLLAPVLIVIVTILAKRLWIEEALGDDADVPAQT